MISGVVNLALNLATVRFIGLYGIVLSTIVSMAIVSAPWITSNIFKLIFKKNPISYVVKIVYYVFSTVLASTVAYVLTSLISINGWIGLIIKAIVCVASSVFVMVILLYRMKEFSDALYLIARMFHLEKLLKKLTE